jgi:hypothetical protein
MSLFYFLLLIKKKKKPYHYSIHLHTFHHFNNINDLYRVFSYFISHPHIFLINYYLIIIIKISIVLSLLLKISRFYLIRKSWKAVVKKLKEALLIIYFYLNQITFKIIIIVKGSVKKEEEFVNLFSLCKFCLLGWKIKNFT